MHTLVDKYPEYKACEIHLVMTDTGVDRSIGRIIKKYIETKLNIPVKGFHIIASWDWSLKCLMKHFYI